MNAQITNDSLITISTDTIIPPNVIPDSLKQDSTQVAILKPSVNDYPLSKDAIEKTITYSAVDSNITDVNNKEIRLFTDSKVEYEQVVIEADQIIINFQENTAKGFAKRSPTGSVVKRAQFTDGATNGTYYELAYNFNSKKAFVKNLKTKEGEFNILGEKSKYIAAENDTITNDDKFFNEKAIITTCNLDHPHFGIRTNKLKFVPDKLAVMGPSQLVLAGIPTPIILPYGFLPLIKGQSSGLIFPSDYEYNDTYGFGLKEIGYYFPISDYMDLKLTGDIYTRGSHGVRIASNYKKRYAYNGNVSLSYSNLFSEDTEGKRLSTKSFSINMRHNQDSKAHPYRNIGGSINISGNQYNRRNNFDVESALKNTYRSSFSYNYNFPDSPFKFSAGLEHSQNTQTNEVNITLPSANLTMRTIQPFKRKVQTGDTKWYEEINLGYKAGLKNFVKTTDTTLFEQETLDNLSTGFSHGATMSFNTRVLKYFTISPSINYDEIYNLRRINKEFDPTPIYTITVIDSAAAVQEIDTTFGEVIESLETQLNSFRKFNAGVSINTQLFATKRFKKGLVRGIRHIAKPSISFNYTPDTKSYYEEVVDTDSRPDYNTPSYYSPFPRSPFPASLSERSMGLNYSINNTVEAKYYSKKDSTEKNLKILENFKINGNYNFAADSMRWSNVSLQGNTRLFKGISTFNLNIRLTPYELENGTTELNSYLVDKKKFPLQLRTLTAGFNSNITIKKMIDIFQGKDDSPSPKSKEKNNQTPIIGDELPSLTSLIENFSISHNYNFTIQKTDENRDTFISTVHTLGIRGDLRLTENWSLGLGNISYNIKDKKFVYPALTFQRDLHCWTMSFGWYPSSKVYNFFIGVKSSALSFLKYDYGQNTFGSGNF